MAELKQYRPPSPQKVCVCANGREHLLRGRAQLGPVLIIKGSGVQLLRRKSASNAGDGREWADLRSQAEDR